MSVTGKLNSAENYLHLEITYQHNIKMQFLTYSIVTVTLTSSDNNYYCTDSLTATHSFGLIENVSNLDLF